MHKIAFICNSYLPLTETFIYEELINIRKYIPVVITAKRINRNLFPYKRIVEVKNYDTELNDIIKQEDIKLIHARFGKIAVQLISAKIKSEVPMLTSFHGYDVPSPLKETRYHHQLRELFEIGEYFTSTSEYMKKRLISLGCPKDKIHVQRSGINLDKFSYRTPKLPRQGEKIKILSVGRLIEKKGMKYLIEAISKIPKEYPVELDIIGDGPKRKYLTNLINKLNLEQFVNLRGALLHEQVRQAMFDAHIFCLASVETKKGYQEGIPNVLKEAMAVGLPVVSTKHAGIPELVEDKINGYLVPERHPRSLAEVITRLIKCPDQWHEMAEYGRKKVEKQYNSKLQVEQLERLYHKAITYRVGKPGEAGLTPASF